MDEKNLLIEILMNHITSVTLYHDKEGGRTSQANIIFLQRFDELADKIISEGFSRRPEPLVRGMEIDIEAFAKEMFEICTFPEPTPWDGLDQRQKDRWKANSMVLKANAHVWLKEIK